MLTRGERFTEARKRLPADKQSMSAVEDATGVSKSLIQALEDDDSSRDVGYTKIISLAKYYRVSIDWLLGISEVASPTISVKAMSSTTGLSERSVDFLMNEKYTADEYLSYKDEILSAKHSAVYKLLNNLLEEEASFFHLSRSYNEYLDAIDAIDNHNIISSAEAIEDFRLNMLSTHKERYISRRNYAKFKLYELLDTFRKIVEKGDNNESGYLE